MACRPRRTRKHARHPRGDHHAARKPNRYPDNGRISFGASCQDKLGVVKEGQFDLPAEGGHIGLRKQQQFGRPLPLGAVLPILG